MGKAIRPASYRAATGFIRAINGKTAYQTRLIVRKPTDAPDEYRPGPWYTGTPDTNNLLADMREEAINAGFQFVRFETETC